MGAQGMKLQGRRQWTWLHIATVVARVSASVPFLQAPVPSSWCKLVQVMAAYTERNLELRDPSSFIVGSKHIFPFSQRETLSSSQQALNQPVLCSMGRHHLCLPRPFTMHTSSERYPRAKTVHASAYKTAETGEAHGELFPRLDYNGF